MLFLEYIYLIPLFPALGAALMFFFGRKLQKATVSAVCVGSVVLAFLMACGAVLQYTNWAPAHDHQPYQTILYTWLGTDTGHLNYITQNGTQAPLQADAGFLLDPLSSIWLLFVTGVGMLIHIYSVGYMAHEGGYYRFFGYLNLIMFSLCSPSSSPTTMCSCSLAGRASASAPTYSSDFISIASRPATPPTKRSSSTASATPDSCSACSSSPGYCGSLRFIDVTAFAPHGPPFMRNN